MSQKTIIGRAIQKHDIEKNWLKAVNFTPYQGEIIVYDIDDNYDYERIKIGDGKTNVNDLPFADSYIKDQLESHTHSWDDLKDKPFEKVEKITNILNEPNLGLVEVSENFYYNPTLQFNLEKNINYKVTINDKSYYGSTNRFTFQQEEINILGNGRLFLKVVGIPDDELDVTIKELENAGIDPSIFNDNREPYIIITILSQGTVFALSGATDVCSLIVDSIATNCNVHEDYEGLLNSDWENNNKSSLGYIKNKPFYVSDELLETVVLEETEFDLSTNYTEVNINDDIFPNIYSVDYMTFELPFSLVKDGVYDVIWDGVKYENLIARNSVLGFVYSQLFSDDPSIIHYPFSIYHDNIINLEPPGKHTLKVIKKDNKVITLPEKFLPNTKKYQSDWDEKNSYNLGYIKNRPFYDTRAESVLANITWDGKFDYSEAIDINSYGMKYVKVSNVSPSINNVLGHNIYNYNGQVTLIGENLINDRGSLYVISVGYNPKVMVVLEDCIQDGIELTVGTYFRYGPSVDDYINSLDYMTDAGELKKLDPKFLPDGIGTQSDWNVNDENNTAFVKNRPFYTTDPQLVELCNQTINTGNFSMGGIYGDDISYSNNYELSSFWYEGNSIQIKWGQELYNSTVKDDKLLGTGLYLGNMSIYNVLMESYGSDISFEDTGEPFMISISNDSIGISTSENLGEIEFVIIINITTDIKMDEKYLPINVRNNSGENSIILNDLINNIASGKYSHAEGCRATASGTGSHAEGASAEASGEVSHAEGNNTIASGSYSHAEGSSTIASGTGTHAEGWYTKASGAFGSHAEGYATEASGTGSHAEGNNTTASGWYSHAEGDNTIANNRSINVIGEYNKYEKQANYYENIYNNSNLTIPTEEFLIGDEYTFDSNTGTFTIINPTSTTELVVGKYVITGDNDWLFEVTSIDSDTKFSAITHRGDSTTTIRGKYAHIVGNGTSDTKRSNAHTLAWDGTAWFANTVKVGGTSQDDENAKTLATTPDWNENDETSSSYITNRPFYRTDEKEIIYEFDWTKANRFEGYEVVATHSSLGVIGVRVGDPVTKEFFDGKYLSYGILEENNTLIDIDESQLDAAYLTDFGENIFGDMFGFMVTSKDNVVFSNVTYPKAGVYIVEGYDGIGIVSIHDYKVAKIDPKFLPDGIGTQSDWVVNDENDPAFIKNRPFYTTDPQPVEIFNGTCEFIDGNTSSNGVMAGFYYSSSELTFNNGYELVEGDKITIIYDGVTYNLVIKNDNGYYGDMSIPTGEFAGNGSYIAEALVNSGLSCSIEDTGEPFVLFGNTILVKTTEATHDITIIGYDKVDIAIPTKYLGFNMWKGAGENSIIANDKNNIASGKYSFAEGRNTTASGSVSHAEGSSTTASGDYSHAEGRNTIASGWYSHAEGSSTTASGDFSHTEGCGTIASGWYSHAEGYYTTASGRAAHAEGSTTEAIGEDSHAEGKSTVADGRYSHAEGFGTVARKQATNVIGRYNIPEEVDVIYTDKITTETLYDRLEKSTKNFYMADSYTFDQTTGKFTLIDPVIVVGKEVVEEKYIQSTDFNIGEVSEIAIVVVTNIKYGRKIYAEHYSEQYGKYAHIVGNGNSDTTRSNSHTLDWEGNAEFQGDVIAYGCDSGETPISLKELYNTIQTLQTKVTELEAKLQTAIFVEE